MINARTARCITENANDNNCKKEEVRNWIVSNVEGRIQKVAERGYNELIFYILEDYLPYATTYLVDELGYKLQILSYDRRVKNLAKIMLSW